MQNFMSLHPKNPHQGRYDFTRLCRYYPALQPFVVNTPSGDSSIDFSDAAAVQALNAAILASDYQITFWQLPAGYLCPPIPGRVDYLHYAADLVTELTGVEPPHGKQFRLLDIGCGANCIYPILAARSFGWHVVGSDIDATALKVAAAIVKANARLKGLIELRLQPKASELLFGIICPGEYYDIMVCNPPFYASAVEAAAANQQKWQKLGKADSGRNFAGTANELWCAGGEQTFIRKLIADSSLFASQVGWFTSLVSQQKHLPPLLAQLQRLAVAEVRQIKMQHGQKGSTILAWRFKQAEI
jgi:23S rRNA (adenine1618-N6)-methyltransferase